MNLLKQKLYKGIPKSTKNQKTEEGYNKIINSDNTLSFVPCLFLKEQKVSSVNVVT
jgi:hypothetical protein